MGKYVYWQKEREGTRLKCGRKKTKIVAEMVSYFKINSQINGPDGNW